MAISSDPPSVLVGPGDPVTGPYYIIIAGLPDKTNWQDVKDFVKSQIPRKLDIYVNISGKRKDSGWIRVIGLKAFKEVRRVLQESPFRGHEILAHNPGYEEDGTGMVLVRAPFFKDKYLFVDPATMPSPAASAVPSPVATSPLNAQPPMSPEAYYLPQGYYAEQEPAMPIHSQQFWWAMQPPTPPNTPKTRQQQQQQYQSGWWMPQDAPPSPQQTVPVKSRKLIITWKDRTRLESDPATDQEKMGTIIQAALSATSERSLDTLECFPGVAVATFRTYSLTRRAMRDLEELESLTVTPVVEETAAPSETNMEKSATPPARKRNSQTAVQQTAPVVVVGSRPLRKRTPPVAQSTATGRGERNNDSTAQQQQQQQQQQHQQQTKTPAVLIVNGSFPRHKK